MRACVQVVVIFKLSEKRVVLLSKKQISTRGDPPFIAEFVRHDWTNVCVPIGWGVKRKQREDQVLVQQQLRDSHREHMPVFIGNGLAHG